MLQGRRTLTALVIVVLLAATALAMVLAYRAERDSARDADEARARQAALAVRQNLTILAAGLRGSSTLVDSDGQVDPERFHEFARGILRETPFSRLSFAEQVTPADRQAFERSLGGPITEIGDSGDFTPLPEDWDESSMAVTLVYPDNPMRRESLGADLLSDSERAPATRAAIRWGPRGSAARLSFSAQTSRGRPSTTRLGSPAAARLPACSRQGSPAPTSSGRSSDSSRRRRPSASPKAASRWAGRCRRTRTSPR